MNRPLQPRRPVGAPGLHGGGHVSPRGAAVTALPGLLAGIVLAFLGATTGAAGGDWPQFLGPNRDGTTPDAVRKSFPGTGPTQVWSRPVGAGFAGPVVVGNRVILHHREGANEVVESLPTTRGGPGAWRQEHPTTYRDRFGFDDGPRATPAVTGGRVFAFGAAGYLSCLELETGKRVWAVDAARDFGADQGFFGFACSPLVHEGLVILNLGGGQGAGVVAFEAATGRLRWKSTDHEAGYAAPVMAAAGTGGEARVASFTREGLVWLDPKTGAVRAEFPWRSRQNASVNAATPLVLGRRVFLTTSYDTGAVLLDLESGAPRKVWSADDSLSAHYASVVHRDGRIYGFHGRQETGTSLRCIEAATGKVAWSKDGLGCGSLLLAGAELVVLTERGELLVASATSAGFEPRVRAQVLGTGVRAYPALAGGRFYARDPRRLVCVELGETDPAGPRGN